MPAVSIETSLFDDWPDAFEEIFAHARLGAGRRRTVTQNRRYFAGARIFRPKQVLFDRHGSSRGKSAVDSVKPPFVIGIAVVRVENDAATGLRILLRGCGAAAGKGRERGTDEQREENHARFHGLLQVKCDA